MCRDCPGCPAGPGTGACTAGPSAGLQQRSPRTTAQAYAPPGFQGPRRASACPRARRRSPSRSPRRAQLGRLAGGCPAAPSNDSSPGCTGWRISKPPRAHLPVLRADTKPRGAGGLETSDPRPPASPGAAVRRGPPGRAAAADTRGRPGPLPAPASSPPPSPGRRRRPRIAALTGAAVASAMAPSCRVRSREWPPRAGPAAGCSAADGEQRPRVARTDKPRAASRPPGALGRRGARSSAASAAPAAAAAQLALCGHRVPQAPRRPRRSPLRSVLPRQRAPWRPRLRRTLPEVSF